MGAKNGLLLHSRKQDFLPSLYINRISSEISGSMVHFSFTCNKLQEPEFCLTAQVKKGSRYVIKLCMFYMCSICSHLSPTLPDMSFAFDTGYVVQRN